MTSHDHPPTTPVPPAAGPADDLMGDPLVDLRAAVADVDPRERSAAGDTARDRLAALAIPPGALGRVGDLAVALAVASRRCPPTAVTRPMLVLAAGDHGVHAADVSPWPQTVTALMVRTSLEERATADVFARAVDATVVPADVGVATPLVPHARLRGLRVRAGTRDLAVEPALTAAECAAAVRAGADLAAGLIADGADLLLTGEMGIANTTAAAALLALTTGGAVEAVTGRGTGIDDATLARKRTAVAAAVARHRDDDPLAQLAGAGGLEHAALVGVLLAGAAAAVPVVLDGVSTVAAATVAVALAPQVLPALVAGHRSPEPGAGAGLAHLGLTPVLDLGLRLGEGTGALLAVPVLRAAAGALTDVATLDEVLGS